MTDAVANVTGINSSIAFGTLLAFGAGVIGVTGIALAIEEGGAIAVGEGVVAIAGSSLAMGQGTLLATGGGLAAFNSPDLVMGQGALWFLLQSPAKIVGIGAEIAEGTVVAASNTIATLSGAANNRLIQFSAGALTIIITSSVATLDKTSLPSFTTRIKAGRVHVSTAGNLAISGIGMTAAAGLPVPFSAAVIYGVGMSIRTGVLAPFSMGVVTSSDSLVDIVDGSDDAVQCISMTDSLITTVTAGNE